MTEEQIVELAAEINVVVRALDKLPRGAPEGGHRERGLRQPGRAGDPPTPPASRPSWPMRSAVR